MLCRCADMNRIIGMLKAAGLCSDVLYKELYISQKEIDGAPSLHSAASEEGHEFLLHRSSCCCTASCKSPRRCLTIRHLGHGHAAEARVPPLPAQS